MRAEKSVQSTSDVIPQVHTLGWEQENFSGGHLSLVFTSDLTQLTFSSSLLNIQQTRVEICEARFWEKFVRRVLVP